VQAIVDLLSHVSLSATFIGSKYILRFSDLVLSFFNNVFKQ